MGVLKPTLSHISEEPRLSPREELSDRMNRVNKGSGAQEEQEKREIIFNKNLEVRSNILTREPFPNFPDEGSTSVQTGSTTSRRLSDSKTSCKSAQEEWAMQLQQTGSTTIISRHNR